MRLAQRIDERERKERKARAERSWERAHAEAGMHPPMLTSTSSQAHALRSTLTSGAVTLSTVCPHPYMRMLSVCGHACSPCGLDELSSCLIRC